MTSSSQYLLIAIVLFIVIVLSLGYSCYNVQPYYSDTLFSHQFAYEGFDLKPSEFHGNAHISGNAMVGGHHEVVSGNVYSVPVEGFEGLHSAPYAETKPLDIFSQAQGGLECKSYGYSNSKGPLCLDATQIKLLSTRGGNATGVDSQIGPQ